MSVRAPPLALHHPPRPANRTPPPPRLSHDYPACAAARHSLFTVSKARVKELNKLNGHPAFGINWMSDRYIKSAIAMPFTTCAFPRAWLVATATPRASLIGMRVRSTRRVCASRRTSSQPHPWSRKNLCATPQESTGDTRRPSPRSRTRGSAAAAGRSARLRRSVPPPRADRLARAMPLSCVAPLPSGCPPLASRVRVSHLTLLRCTTQVESELTLSTGSRLSIDLSPQQVASCSPSTGQYGCLGCEGGFTEGAYEYLKTAPGLANSFYIPYEQSLTASSTTAKCPTAKVAQIDGELQQLSGGYAKVTGYKYAVTPCTSGGCTSQNLNALKAALEKGPVSVCVNARAWNDYVGGVMTSAACGPMGAEYQDHCVMATGFNATAPVPYWIVRNSWSSTFGEDGYIRLEMAKNTCGLADDVTIPTVKLDMTEEEHAEAKIRREAMYQTAVSRAKLG